MLRQILHIDHNFALIDVIEVSRSHQNASALLADEKWACNRAPPNPEVNWHDMLFGVQRKILAQRVHT